MSKKKIIVRRKLKKLKNKNRRKVIKVRKGFFSHVSYELILFCCCLLLFVAASLPYE